MKRKMLKPGNMWQGSPSVLALKARDTGKPLYEAREMKLKLHWRNQGVGDARAVCGLPTKET